MARIARPKFRSRQQRFSERQQRSRPPRAWLRRIDWLFPALHERGGSLKDTLDDVLDVSVPWPLGTGIQVVDGDTVRSGGRTYRLVGFNTPEAGRLAHCREERALASKAKDSLRELVGTREVALSRVACACEPGTEGTDACNFGRLCGRLKADGRDVGQILIAEGLAERYACWGASCPRRKDWCAG